MPDSLPYTPLEGRTLLDELNHRIKNELARPLASERAAAMAVRPEL